MTSLPAQTFHLKNKGMIREGLDADLVVFDPKTIKDCSTYEDPFQPPQGIKAVFVNGELAVNENKVLGARSGKVLRHQS